jgi:RimJ/RimL family protein N-acetyltransferase
VTSVVSALDIRPITGPGELGLFNQFPYVLNDELAGDLADGHRQPGWLWVALRDGRLAGRAAWWGSPGQSRPALLDFLDFDDPDTGERLLRTAMAAVVTPRTPPPEYLRFLPPDWRADPVTRQPVEDRIAVAERTGAQLLVERLRLEWRPGTPVAASDGRLVFRPVTDEAELLALMTSVLDGTLDAHSRDDLTRMSPERAAAEQFEGELARYSTPREWWRIAALPSGEPVGFVIPARNHYNPIIAYLGVVPAHRGQGYISQILAEGTRILAAQDDVPHIRASTDVGNVPMAQAFARAGWVTFERQISMVWPRGLRR